MEFADRQTYKDMQVPSQTPSTHQAYFSTVTFSYNQHSFVTTTVDRSIRLYNLF